MAFLFGGGTTKVEIPPPPPVPAPTTPPLSPEQQALLSSEQQLLNQNLTSQQEQLAQDQAVRAAIEQATGLPFSQLIAGQFAQQQQLGTLQSQLQAAQLQQAQAQRAAFIQATGLTPEQATAQEAARQVQLSQGLADRYQRALSGTLPVSPGLEQSLDRQFGVLTQQLQNQLGSGYAVSTPGIQALSEFGQRRNALEEASRTGAISEAEQFGFGSSPLTQAVQNAYATSLQGAGGVPNPLALTQQFSGFDQFQTPPQLGQLYSALQQQQGLGLQQQGLALNQANLGYQGQLQGVNLQAQSAAAQQANQGALLGALLGFGGQLGGAYLYGNALNRQVPTTSISPSAYGGF